MSSRHLPKWKGNSTNSVTPSILVLFLIMTQI